MRGVGPAHEGLNVVRLNLVVFPKVIFYLPKHAVLLNQHSLQITDHLQTPCGGARGRRRAEAEREAERVEKEGEQHGVREVGVREGRPGAIKHGRARQTRQARKTRHSREGLLIFSGGVCGLFSVYDGYTLYR